MHQNCVYGSNGFYILGFDVNVTRKGLQTISIYERNIQVRRNDIYAVQPRGKIRRLDNPNNNNDDVFVNRSPFRIGETVVLESLGQRVRSVPAISVVSTKPFYFDVPSVIAAEEGILTLKATLKDQGDNVESISQIFEIQVTFISLILKLEKLL